MATKKPAAEKAEPKTKVHAPAPTSAPVPSEPPAVALAPATPAEATEPAKPFSQPVVHEMNMPSDTTAAVHRLERARSLPELAAGEKAKLVADGIQSFKDVDRRTMNVVIAGGTLHKQEV
jgi:hypothetical protein